LLSPPDVTSSSADFNDLLLLLLLFRVGMGVIGVYNSSPSSDSVSTGSSSVVVVGRGGLCSVLLCFLDFFDDLLLLLLFLFRRVGLGVGGSGVGSGVSSGVGSMVGKPEHGGSAQQKTSCTPASSNTTTHVGFGSHVSHDEVGSMAGTDGRSVRGLGPGVKLSVQSTLGVPPDEDPVGDKVGTVGLGVREVGGGVGGVEGLSVRGPRVTKHSISTQHKSSQSGLISQLSNLLHGRCVSGGRVRWIGVGAGVKMSEVGLDVGVVVVEGRCVRRGSRVGMKEKSAKTPLDDEIAATTRTTIGRNKCIFQIIKSTKESGLSTPLKKSCMEVCCLYCLIFVGYYSIIVTIDDIKY